MAMTPENPRASHSNEGAPAGTLLTKVFKGSDPSSIAWFRERELSSVDNLDEPAGRAALVFVLAGSQGAYGRDDSAQALLPPVVRRAR
ncbi:MAG: copper transporter [Actinobacteria bacterium]|nr:copper transporter [Actinomycetota bacterium]